jgi:hypothetical protein
VENCTDWLTTTVGFDGRIAKVDEDVDPDRETVCGLLVAVSVNERVATRAPDTVGLNTTEAVQLADAARVVPHVFVKLKSAAFAPDRATLLMLMEVEPPLFSVAV